MTTKTDKLWAELRQLNEAQQHCPACAEQTPPFNTCGPCWDKAVRVAEIRKELLQLARRKAQSKAHRELLFDLNGHYGPA